MTSGWAGSVIRTRRRIFSASSNRPEFQQAALLDFQRQARDVRLRRGLPDGQRLFRLANGFLKQAEIDSGRIHVGPQCQGSAVGRGGAGKVALTCEQNTQIEPGGIYQRRCRGVGSDPVFTKGNLGSVVWMRLGSPHCRQDRLERHMPKARADFLRVPRPGGSR